MEQLRRGLRGCRDRDIDPWAPWYVVPADHNWVRNLAVAELVAQTLERLDPKLRLPTLPSATFTSSDGRRTTVALRHT